MKLIFLFFLISTYVHAAKRFVIYTDQPSQTRANELAEYMRNVSPFNEFDIEYEVRSMQSYILGCRADPNIARNISCNNELITQESVAAGFDQAFVVSNISSFGGSGGSVPVMTTASSVPLSMMVHEYLHTIGFGDEYAYYTALEADRFCEPSEIRRFVNLAMIQPLAGGYSSDTQARSLHDDDIPWFNLIPSDVLITTGSSLGTPPGPYGGDIYGLFPAETCNLATDESRRTIWKPGNTSGVMSGLYNDIGNLAPLIRIALRSQNFPEREEVTRRRLEASEEAPPVLRNYEFSPAPNRSAPTCSALERGPISNNTFDSSLNDFAAINNVIVNGVSRPTQPNSFSNTGYGFSSAPWVQSPSVQPLNLSTVEFKPRGQIDNPYMKMDLYKNAIK